MTIIPTDLKAIITNFEALRPSLGDAAVNAAIAALLEALRPSLGDAAVNAAIAALRACSPTPGTDITGQAQINRDNQGQNVGVNFGVIQMLLPSKPATDPPPPQPEPSTLVERIETLLAHMKVQEEQREQQQRDVLSAAERYQALGRRTGVLAKLLQTHLIEIEAELRKGLVQILVDPAQLLPVDKRMQAGFLLSELGDPRFPVTIEQWQQELRSCNDNFGILNGYWCYIRPDTYRISGWKENEGANISLPAFWIARYPLTVAQYRAFITAGGYKQRHYWTQMGWAWKEVWSRKQPYLWDDARYTRSNQAVVGVTWYEATAYCTWLTNTLTNVLPAGYTIRLPSEAEWEVAAAYDETMICRTHPWGENDPTSELAIFADDQGKNLGGPVSVGVCPAGASACGALDMVGQVWEWCSSSYDRYPAESEVSKQDFLPAEWDMPWRGGSWRDNRTYMRAGTRMRSTPSDGEVHGFRVLLALQR